MCRQSYWGYLPTKHFHAVGAACQHAKHVMRKYHMLYHFYNFHQSEKLLYKTIALKFSTRTLPWNEIMKWNVNRNQGFKIVSRGGTSISNQICVCWQQNLLVATALGGMFNLLVEEKGKQRRQIGLGATRESCAAGSVDILGRKADNILPTKWNVSSHVTYFFFHSMHLIVPLF